MDVAPPLQKIPCPACGGAGGGPFGPAGSAWDVEDWVCPRCEGAGAIRVQAIEAASDTMRESQRPGLVKAVPDAAAAPAPKKRKATA